VFVNNIAAKLLYNLCLLDFFTFGAVVFCEFRVETRFLVGEVVVCVTVVTVVTVITVVTVVTVVTDFSQIFSDFSLQTCVDSKFTANLDGSC
jgi:hypothetical protein